MKVTKKSAVKKVAATIPATTAPAAKAAKVTDIQASKYKGRTTGMRVMEYQDTTFAANTKAMLTDEELAANWRAEFPEAVAFTVNHVAGARRDYNNGRHSKAFQRPAVAVDAYLIVAGKRVAASTIEAAPKPKAVKTAAKATPAAPAAAVATPAAKPTAKGTAKAIGKMKKAS